MESSHLWTAVASFCATFIASLFVVIPRVRMLADAIVEVATKLDGIPKRLAKVESRCAGLHGAFEVTQPPKPVDPSSHA